MILQFFFLGTLILGLDGRTRIRRTDCYTLNERVVKLYESLGCAVEEHLLGCYKSPICPDGCIGEDREKHAPGDVWLDEGGVLKCTCLAPREYWNDDLPAIPTGGVMWPPAKKCQYLGCQSKLDPKVIIKPNTEANIVDEVCYCTEGKDASGGVAYTLYCLPA
ncbi:uncharacterized protein LOC135496322 isoform X3 [Lineus longissimus]|uniref:uncharacterized protein LOC135496322 isoform X3 n=1 Tax=Lineus longissimus TaxID=88925 RepID=UPI002B4FA6A9